jgi:hypothetical protein
MTGDKKGKGKAVEKPKRRGLMRNASRTELLQCQIHRVSHSVQFASVRHRQILRGS